MPVFTAAMGKASKRRRICSATMGGSMGWMALTLPGNLGDDAGDGGDAVGAERAHGFEIGLRAGSGAVVGTGDGEDDGKGGHLGFRI
jgi:hypothetical protein